MKINNAITHMLVSSLAKNSSKRYPFMIITRKATTQATTFRVWLILKNPMTCCLDTRDRRGIRENGICMD
jgi:hypothetical protein